MSDDRPTQRRISFQRTRSAYFPPKPSRLSAPSSFRPPIRALQGGGETILHPFFARPPLTASALFAVGRVEFLFGNVCLFSSAISSKYPSVEDAPSERRHALVKFNSRSMGIQGSTGKKTSICAISFYIVWVPVPEIKVNYFENKSQFFFFQTYRIFTFLIYAYISASLYFK